MKKIASLKSALVISPTHAEEERVTARVRARLKEVAKLGREDREFLQLKNLQWTEAQRGDARNYQAGLVVQFNRFGHLRSGSTVLSNALKTRCLRCYVRFNDLQEGAHLLDAVEPEDLSDKAGTDFLTAMPHLAGYRLPQIAGFEEAFSSAYCCKMGSTAGAG